ncbi:molecular chaperone DnaJ [Candidatus Campbellbacteria bacterium RIFOXYC2_FULL_35_25]|uniref:Chaperone protein DnaJ n=1 Tax=Candidatus Campbellbacteria bacterium RIFOXYC2_FULL_35_25 TaxID=1797582 RepID=A0A1F5EJJ7_9BACT|nr:MAG: molecular chaperone DnaJ [Candidatus Campbellbacteria bacterium RIFOXYC2_FULL_35_25]
MDEDYYKILGVGKSSSKNEIKKAFHKLAHKYHPDKKGGDEVMFKKISEAYSVLSDDKKKAEYDAYGKVFSEGGSGGAQGFDFGGAGFDFSSFAQQQASGGVDFDLGDIFGDIFGGGRPKTKRGNDIAIDLEISFKEAVFGVQRKVFITKNSVCDSCSGSGAKPGSEKETCSICNGNGQIHETKRSLLGTFSSARMCDHCHGKGSVPKNKCSSCHGEGVSRKQTEIVVNIPLGINNGEMIRLSGSGEAIAGGISGDLYIKIHVSDHKTFRREGNNLVMDLNIKLTDALLGSSYDIETLEERINLKIPAGVKFGEILRIREKGISMGNSKRGDILVKLNIQLPDKLSKKTKSLIEEIKKEGI